MASTPIELRHVGSSSPSFVDHRQSLLSPSGKPKKSREASITAHRGSSSRWRSLPWKFEILCWILSLCFFIAIVIALFNFNNRPLPNLPLSINSNAIIQLLGTFGQAFLMVPVASALGQMKWLRALQVRPVDEFRAMDEASRGASGSVLLLVRGKGGLIASCGALITILALAIGFFVQQTLRYDTVYPSSNEAFMPIARFMNGTGSALVPGTSETTSGVDTEMESAAYLGLFSPAHTIFTASAQCITGNCTWESYRTLAICNTCADLTSHLNMTSVENKIDNDPNNTYHTDSYTLPNGVALKGIEQMYLKGPSHTPVLNITTIEAPNLAYASIAFANNASALLSIFAVGLSPGNVPIQPDADITLSSMTGKGFGSPLAFECLLQFCVQEMRAEFQSGVLKETVTHTWTNNTQIGKGQVITLAADTIIHPPTSGDQFIATQTAVEATADWLSHFVSGNATVMVNTALINLERVDVSQGMVQPILTAMNNSATGFPDLMDNLAGSLSRALRTLPYQPQPFNGSAFSVATHAKVHWPWLALPFFLLVASLALLIAVMVETNRKGLVPWTNNILAALFHGIDKRSGGHHADETRDAMEDEARTLLVEFQPYEDGGRLVVARSSGLEQKGAITRERI